MNDGKERIKVTPRDVALILMMCMLFIGCIVVMIAGIIDPHVFDKWHLVFK